MMGLRRSKLVCAAGKGTKLTPLNHSIAHGSARVQAKQAGIPKEIRGTKGANQGGKVGGVSRGSCYT
mgnify:CR=1